MSERNLLQNGRYLSNLSGWGGGASYAAGDGSEHYGIASLPDGASLTQGFSVPHARAYTLSVDVKPLGGNLTTGCTATITDGAGNTVLAVNLTGTSATWGAVTSTFGLPPGSYTLEIANASGQTVYLDDAWLWPVAITRAQLAARVHAKLGRLATGNSLSTTPAGALTEGSYTYAIDAALRIIGAVDDETGEPDVRWIEPEKVNDALGAVQSQALEMLRNDTAGLVDVKIGPREEKLSQMSDRLTKLTGASGAASSGSRRATMGNLSHKADDYEL